MTDLLVSRRCCEYRGREYVERSSGGGQSWVVRPRGSSESDFPDALEFRVGVDGSPLVLLPKGVLDRRWSEGVSAVWCGLEFGVWGPVRDGMVRLYFFGPPSVARGWMEGNPHDGWTVWAPVGEVRVTCVELREYPLDKEVFGRGDVVVTHRVAGPDGGLGEVLPGPCGRGEGAGVAAGG